MSETQEYIKHGSKNSHNFVFPSIISEGFRFINKDQIKEYLNTESSRAADPTLNTLFKFDSAKTKSNRVRLKCRLCPCFINLDTFQDCLVVKSFKNEHDHSL